MHLKSFVSQSARLTSQAKQAINSTDWYDAESDPRNQGGNYNRGGNNSYNDFDDYNRNQNSQRNNRYNDYGDHDRRGPATEPYARKQSQQSQQQPLARSGQLPRHQSGWDDWDKEDDWSNSTPQRREANDNSHNNYQRQENRTPQRSNASSNSTPSTPSTSGNKNVKTSGGWEDDDWAAW